MSKHFLITGSSGYIGGRLAELALARGHRLTLLNRSATGNGATREGIRQFAFSFGAVPPDEVFVGVDTFIHLATTSNDPDSNYDIEVEGSRRLFDAAKVHEVPRVIVASSIVVHAEPLSDYGRCKVAIERLLTEPTEFIIRPGFVYGGAERGAYGVLCRLVRTTPVLPVVNPDRPIQLIHIDDLCHAILMMAEGANLDRRIYDLAAAEPLTFGEFLKLLRRQFSGRSLRIFSIPISFALLAASATRWAPFIPTVPRERVLGLATSFRVDTTESLRALGLTVAPISRPERTAVATLRRALQKEGRALLAYILGSPPPSSLLKRYVWAVLKLDNSAPCQLPWPCLRWPWLLGFVEPVFGEPAADGSGLRTRLRIAEVLAEATPLGAKRYMNLQPTGRVVTLLKLSAAGIGETVRFPFRILLGRNR